MFDAIDQTKLPIVFVYKAPRSQIVTAENVSEFAAAVATRCGHIGGHDLGCMACRDTEAMTATVDIAGAAQVYPKE